jgi:hypothetical protein
MKPLHCAIASGVGSGSAMRPWLTVLLFVTCAVTGSPRKEITRVPVGQVPKRNITAMMP